MADDRERAVKEVAQVYERIKIQQPLLLHCSSPPTATRQLQVAQSLLGDALRALNVALSVINQPPPPPPAAAAAPTRCIVKAEPQRLSADSQATETTPRRAKKRRSSVMEEEGHQKLSWVDFTTVPYEDGYEWRKYGEKKINGTSYTRSYFRCTYKDDTGCIATKHIQQTDSSSCDDSPLFQVTYNNKHTCNNTCTTTTAAANRSKGLMMTNSPDLNGYAAIIKQEPPVLPPLIEASALPFDQTLPFQQEPLLFPVISVPQQLERDDCHGNIPSTSSSCISGESALEDMNMMGQTMAAEEASAEDDFELLRFLCNSFREY